MELKILWICGCNSLSVDGMLTNCMEFLKDEKVTHIVDYFDIDGGKYSLEGYDKIIYDDSYSACSCDPGERTSYYLKFATKNSSLNFELNSTNLKEKMAKC